MMKQGLMKRQQGAMPPGMSEQMEEMQEPVDNRQEEGQEQGDQAQQIEQLLKPAVQALYGENFGKMIEMFKANGVEQFGLSMATAINAALEKLEADKPLPPEIAAGVGMKLFFMLLEDIVTGGVLPKLEIQTIQQALAETVKMYADAHPDTVTQEDMQQFIQQLAQAERQGATQ